MRLGRAGGHQAGSVLRLHQPEIAPNEVGGEPDVGDLHLAGVLRSRVEHQARLEPTEGDGGVGVHRVASHQARLSLHPGGDVHRQHRPAGVVDQLDSPGELVFRIAAESRPEDGIHDDVGSNDLAAETLLAVGLPYAAGSLVPPTTELNPLFGL